MREGYSVRRLINEAFRASTVRGLGDVPEDAEAEDALDLLNGYLDELVSDTSFSTGKRSVSVRVGPKGYVTITDDPKRVTTSLIVEQKEGSRFLTVSASTEVENGFDDGTPIIICAAGKQVPCAVNGIVDPWSFNAVFTSPSILEPGTYNGYVKLYGEGPERDIDIIDVPPASIYQVIGCGDKLPQLTEQNFHSESNRTGRWYFYDKGRNPYPRVYVGGCQEVKIVYDEPFWHDLEMDSDLTNMPRTARECLKWHLAMELADIAQFETVARRCERTWKNCYQAYVDSMEQDVEFEPDISAPGYGGYSNFDIRNG